MILIRQSCLTFVLLLLLKSQHVTLGFNRKGISRRTQQQSPAFESKAPSRQCGEVIQTSSRQNTSDFLSAYTSYLFSFRNNSALEASAISLVTAAVQYSVQARVVCGSCQDIYQSYTGEAFLDDNINNNTSARRNGFPSFCGPDRYAHNVTFSGLALIPVDDSTQKPIAGRLKTFVCNVGVAVPQQACPTGWYPADFGPFLNNATFLAENVRDVGELLPAVLAASSGTVAIMPDYLGKGHSHGWPISVTVKQSYQKAGVAIWLKTKRLVEEETGCETIVDKTVTVSGSSEGGYAAFSQTLSFVDMGFDVLSAQIVAAPLRLEHQIASTIGEIANKTASSFSLLLLPLVGASFSSTNPDLVNTGRQQELAATEWLNDTDPSRNLVEWASTDQTATSMLRFLPTDPLTVINPALVDMAMTANARGLITLCELAVPGDTDLLCEAIVENNLISEVESTPVPTTLCYSREDDVISYGNLPNLSKSSLLSEFSLFGQTASGDHATAIGFCVFSQIAPFTVLRASGSRVPNSIEPVTMKTPLSRFCASSTTPEPSTRPVSSVSSPSGTPTRIPTTPIPTTGTPASTGTTLPSPFWVSTVVIMMFSLGG